MTKNQLTEAKKEQQILESGSLSDSLMSAKNKFKGFDFFLDHGCFKVKKVEIRNLIFHEASDFYSFEVKCRNGSWYQNRKEGNSTIESGNRCIFIESDDNFLKKTGYSCRVWTLNGESFAIAAVKDELGRFFRDKIAEINYYSVGLKNPVAIMADNEPTPKP